MASTLSPDAIDQIRSMPAATPPAGITPDFDNPHNGNAITMGAIIASLVIATVIGMLRVYS